MTRIFRAPVLVLIVLAAGAGLLLMTACGGSSNAATQVSATPASSVAVHQATAVPAAVTTAPTVAPTAAPVPATAAPVTPAPATPAPVPTDAPPQFTAPVDVNVTLAEWKIQSSLAVFHVGVPYHFIITNNGKIAHELNVANLDARPVAPGATVTLDLTFPSPIQSEFACHLPSHYEAGMRLPVTVEA